MRHEDIARVAHEANRAYCLTIGDGTQYPWSSAPEWQKESARIGVQFHAANPEATPEDSHQSWLEQKLTDGWKYGEVKDVEKKEHPCFVPYAKLPKAQRVKDHLYLAVVRALLDA